MQLQASQCLKKRQCIVPRPTKPLAPSHSHIRVDDPHGSGTLIAGSTARVCLDVDDDFECEIEQGQSEDCVSGGRGSCC